MDIAISASWLLPLILTGIAALLLWTKSKRNFPDKIPPFPSQPWPILGHFWEIRSNSRDKMKAWRKAAGDIYSLDIGGELHILVNDYNLIKEIWVKHADYIVNSKQSFAAEILAESNKGIMTARDNNWKEQRTTSLSILRLFGMGKNVMAEKIQEEVSYVLEKLGSFKGQPEDVRLLLNVCVSNVICSVAVGQRFEHDDPYFVRFMILLRDALKYNRSVAILTPFKYLYYLPGDLFHAKKWTKASTEINERFGKVYINKLKQAFKENEDPENFVAAYIKEMKKLNDNGADTNLSEENLVAIIRLLFLAGTETISTTILWCLLYMLHYPEVQEKVYREIEAHVGIERIPNMFDKPKLVYLNAVIMETQRFASLIPVGIMREVSDTFELGGFTLPKGSILWPVLDSVHYEKKIWGDPENFRPERFIDANGVFIHREELIPFCIGRRMCLGMALARMELFLFLSAMFQRFKFEPADNSGILPTLKESFGTSCVPQPYKIKFTSRRGLV
ncbi:unnamed protein product [Candidula unifasciata]|uniref:Cytochrome P450 n=1 Tax=Candidula unifasciata TaxID=100452 RepID=A0A8S3YKB1_9EUPU|nr:unnamed protein product [Candidula unifasciata]